MKIKTLRLYNFRNFANIDEIVFPSEPLLVAAAPNATGKTNFLESLHILLRGKSFRASLPECVGWNQDEFFVEGRITHGDSDSFLAVRYSKPLRSLRIEEDEVPVSPVTFYSHYPFVLFLPEDTFMFTRGPAIRRNFFNTILSSSPQYVSALVQYHRVLQQRNMALKKATSKVDVEAWTDLLIEYATSIWNAREALVQFLNMHVQSIYKDFTGEDLKLILSLSYGASDHTHFRKVLDDAWLYETKYHYTLHGPHRDDLLISAANHSVKSSFSRGQSRALVIALKVAGYMFMKQSVDEEPLLLFDEVLSELDEARQRALLQHLPNTQILLTCTHLPAQLKRRDDVFMLDLRKILQPLPQTQPVSPAVTAIKVV